MLLMQRSHMIFLKKQRNELGMLLSKFNFEGFPQSSINIVKHY